MILIKVKIKFHLSPPEMLGVDLLFNDFDASWLADPVIIMFCSMKINTPFKLFNCYMYYITLLIKDTVLLYDRLITLLHGRLFTKKQKVINSPLFSRLFCSLSNPV